MPTTEAARHIIENREVVPDRWTFLADDAPVPFAGPVVVSWARWQAERDALAGRADLGVQVPSDVGPEDVAPHVDHFALIALEFPKFTDGRAYSTARLLRQRYGYRGTLRAVGDVLRDQLFYMARCGFNAFQLKQGKDVDDALRAFEELSVKYQPAADDPLPLWKRHRRAP